MTFLKFIFSKMFGLEQEESETKQKLEKNINKVKAHEERLKKMEQLEKIYEDEKQRNKTIKKGISKF